MQNIEKRRKIKNQKTKKNNIEDDKISKHPMDYSSNQSSNVEERKKNKGHKDNSINQSNIDYNNDHNNVIKRVRFSNKSDSSSEISHNINNNNKLNKKEKIKLKTIVLIIISAILIILVGIIILFIYKPWRKKAFSNEIDEEEKGSNQKEEFENEQNDPDSSSKYSDNIIDNPEEESEEDTFIIVEKPQLKRIKINKKSMDNILVEGMNQNISLYKENIYDVSIYKEYGSGKEAGIAFSKKYTYSILLLKQCINTENEIEECEINENNNNLRYLVNNQEEEIPFCFFDIINNNIILSIKCPEYISENKKLEIISDLDYIKNFIDIENNNSNNNNNLENNRIESCGYKCLNEKYVLDKDNSTYKEISWKNKTISNNDGYKIKKEIKIEHKAIDKNKDFYDKIYNNIDYNKLKKEKLYESEEIEESGNNFINANEIANDNYNDIVIFNKDILDFKISINNRIENKDGNLKAFLILKINNSTNNIVYLNKKFELNDINEYNSNIDLINNLGNELSNNIINTIEGVTDDISNIFNDLNNEIYYQNLENIINYIKGIKSDSSGFINEIDSTKNILEGIINKVSENIETFSNQINSNISIYNAEIIDLTNKIYENIGVLKNLLNSPENSDTKLSNYYLNNTSASYSDIIEKSKDIFDNYYKLEKEAINKAIRLLFNKFENGIDAGNKIDELYEYKKYFNVDGDISTIDNKLSELNNTIPNIIQKVKDEIENKKSIKENGYYILDNEITSNNNKFNNMINDFSNINSNPNNLDIVDKIFDQIMIGFKDNFTNLLKYLEDEKNKRFPLEEDVLKDNYFNFEEKQKIKNDIDEISNDIINSIKEKSDLYLNNIQQEIERISNEKKDLNSYIINLEILCSKEYLKELTESFENALKNYLNKIKDNINKIFNTYKKYLSNQAEILEKLDIDEKYDSISCIYINEKIENVKKFKDYISKQLIKDLSKEYSDILNNIREILIKIRRNQLNNKYKEIDDLSFINENINNVNILYERINLYFSNEVFNISYQNEFKIIEEIKDISINFIDNFKQVKQCNEYELYIKLNSGDSLCFNIFDEKSEVLNLNLINSDINFMRFKNKLNIFYSSLNESMNSYNSEIEESLSSLIKIADQKSIIYNLNFNPIENKINTLLSQKYGTELIKSCYDYFQSNTNQIIENLMNDFLELTNKTYDFLKEEISKNINKFKKSISEFGIMAAIYQNILTQNLTRNYFDFIIDNQKNNFNYTISYYYNIFINLINSTHKKIINNLPHDKNGFNINIEECKNAIDSKFDELIIKIKNSKSDSLMINRQTNTMSVPRTNFFKANLILSNVVLAFRNLLQKKAGEISALDNGKSNTRDLFASKLYLENSINAKLIEDYYSIIYNDENFDILNTNKFKEIIIDNFEFDKDDFINKLNLLLDNLNLENHGNFLKLEEDIIKMFDNEINKYITNENKEGVLDKINYLYDNEFKLNDNQINEIYENIYEILNKIIKHLKQEKERIEKDEIQYKSDYSIIEKKLAEYKNEIVNNIENIVIEIVNEFRENIMSKVYNNKIEVNLNNYIEEIKSSIEDYEDKKFFNSSYNLGKIIQKINEDLVIKYKEKIKKQIIYKNELKLIDIINIEEIKELINKKIDYEYNNNLLLKLKAYQNNKKDIYDFNSGIDTDIKSTINTKLNNIDTILLSLKDQNKINNIDLPILSLSTINQKIENIYNQAFNNFISLSISTEKNKLIELLNNIIINNFTILLNNTICSFGNEYFERYMKYNEIFKIRQLIGNYKYFLVEALLYYEILYSFKAQSITIPKDLISKIHNLNNLDKIIKVKSEEILNKVNNYINNFKEIVKDDIIQKYISDIKEVISINSKFSRELINEINIYVNKFNIKDFEENYYNILNNNLNENFYAIYIKELNIQKDQLLNIIKSNQNDIKREIPDNTNDNNDELNNINSNLNKFLEYYGTYTKNYKNTFNISDESINELINLYNNMIYNAFKNLDNKITNEKNKTKNIIHQNFTDIKDSFNKNNFIQSSNKTFPNIINKINNITNNINDYSRKLENLKLNTKLNNNGEETSTEQQTTESGESIFQKISSFSEKNKYFIDTFDEVKKINDLMNKFESSFQNSKNLVKNGNFQEDMKMYILSELSKTRQEYLYYLKNISDIFYSKKGIINNLIIQADDLIKKEYQNEKNIINKNKNMIDQKLKENKEKQNEEYIPINYTYSYFYKDYMIKVKILYNNINSFNINYKDDKIYKQNIQASLKNKIKFNELEIKIIHDSGNYKIFIIFDFDDNDYTKIKYDFQIFDINSNGISEENKCIGCSKPKTIENKLNEDLNLLK